MSSITEKKCTKCGEVKLVSEFYMGSLGGKPKINSWCKVCFCKQSREYQIKNKDRKNENQRRRYYANIEKERERAKRNAKTHREKHSVEYYKYQKEWRENNADKMRDYYKKYYYAHREISVQRHKDWKDRNPGQNREYKNARRARKLKAGGEFTAKQFKELCDKYHNVCLCCKQALPLVADHVIPLSKGGNNSIENIQPLCWNCNASKHARFIDYR